MKNLNELFAACDAKFDGANPAIPPKLSPIDIVLKVLPTNIGLEDGETIIHFKVLMEDKLEAGMMGALRRTEYEMEIGLPLADVELAPKTSIEVEPPTPD